MFGKHVSRKVSALSILLCLSMVLSLVGSSLAPMTVSAAAPEPPAVLGESGALAPAQTDILFHTNTPTPFLPEPAAAADEAGTQPIEPIVLPPDPAPMLPHMPPASVTATVEPEVARPGDTVVVTVRFESEADLEGASLSAALQAGLAPAAGERAEYALDTRTASLDVDRVAAKTPQELQLSLVVGEDAPDLTVQRIDLWATGYAGPASAQVVVKRAFPSVEGVVTPEKGGTLRSADGRVQVVFPEGAVDKTVRVQHVPKRVDRIPLQAGGLGIEFELNAFSADDAATPVHQFAKPLELRVDMTGLVNLSDLAYWQYGYLAYWNEEKEQWNTILSHREGNVLVAELDHFTTLGGGTGNNYESGWLLAFNDAHVSTFNGGLSYDYAIEVPEGRGGLTPDVNLNYNNRRTDGILTWIQTDWAGLGWTLDSMSIARKVTPSYDDSDQDGIPAWWWDAYVNWDNKFTLMYKGTGYKLIPETGSAYGRYYTEDEQFLYIERRNVAGGDSSAPNETGEYWIVKLRDGTECRLGHTSDSEQVVSSVWYTVPGSPAEQTYAGDTSGRVAFQWRVDAMTDTNGSKIEYSYVKEVGTQGSTHDRASYLSEIRYNYLTGGWGTKILFNRTARSSDGVGDQYQAGQHYYFYQDYYLSSIRIQNWDNGQYNTVREYVLAYEATSAGGHDNNTRLLHTITEYGTTGTGGSSLPATHFGYTVYYNKDWNYGSSSDWELEFFRYDRLTSIDNGYNGTITLTYETPDGGWYQAWNYRVATKVVSSTSGGNNLAYSYAPSALDRCYQNPYSADSYGCYFHGVYSTTGGSLIGYRTVTETLKTTADSTVSITGHQSQLDTIALPDRSKGMETVTRLQNEAGAEQKRVETTYVTETLGSPTRYFAHPEYVREYTRDNGSMPANPQKTTYTQYETAKQGNDQYGNLTQVQEYTGQNLYRSTLTYYYPLTTTGWILDKPGLVWLKDGAGNTVAKNMYIYDSTGHAYNDPPDRGNLVQTKRLSSVAASTWLTVETITRDSSYYYLPTAVTDANNNTTATTYDNTWKRYPLTVDPPLIDATTYQYDYVLGKPNQITGPNGANTAVDIQYDVFGRVTKVIKPGDSSSYPTIEYQYSDASNPLKITTLERVTSGSATTIPTFRYYNGLGQLIQQNQGTTDSSLMTVQNTTFNAFGQIEHAYLPYTTTYSASYVNLDTGKPKAVSTYDALGRTTIVTSTDSTMVRSYYDAFKIAVIDENNHQKVSENDVFGRLATVKEYTGTFAGGANFAAGVYATTTYAYTVTDQLTGITDAASNSTSIAYDSLGRKVDMTDPDMGHWYYRYDSNGNLTKQRDARDKGVCFYYDALNRLTGKTYHDSVSNIDNLSCPGSGYVATYSYDAYDGSTQYGKGYRTGMTDGSGSATWKYNSRGLVSAEYKTLTGSGTYTTTWSYNARDLVLTQVYPGTPAETVTTGYDVWGRPSTLSGSSSYVTSATYDALSRLDLVTFGNSQQTDWIYYSSSQKGGRLYQLKTGTSGQPTQTQYLEYDYDSVGNVTSLKDYNNSSQIQTFAYDELDRLTSASTNAAGSDQYSDAYAYSTIGNISTFDGTAYTYTDAAHKHAVTTLGATQKYWYDANGNATRRDSAAGRFDLTYDHENRLTGVSNAATASFTYDGDGNRVKGVVGGVTTYYVGTYFETGSAWAKYYTFAGMRIAVRDASGLTYIHGDHLGSATNTTGQNVSSQRYYPYGKQRSAAAAYTPYRFTGQKQESTIELYFYNARWYDPALGRFLSPDTVYPKTGDPQSLNRYAYVRNNPTRYIDPTGHFLDTLFDIVSVVVDIVECVKDPSAANFGALALDVAAAAIPILPAGAGLLARGGKALGVALDVAKGVDKMADAADAGRAVDKMADAVEIAAKRAGKGAGDAAKIPNPGGRLGGSDHMAGIKRAEALAEERKLVPSTEYRIATPGGAKGSRYVDVAGLDPDTFEPKLFIQVGDVTASGNPVARELSAMQDIAEHSEWKDSVPFLYLWK